MKTLIARYTVKEGSEDQVAAFLQEMAQAVESDEPGCVLYRVCRLDEPSNVFVLFEEYDSEESLLAHRDTPHYQRYVAESIAPLLDKREREVGVPVVRSTGS